MLSNKCKCFAVAVLGHRRLLHGKPSINDADLLHIIRNNADSTFLAVSRNAVSRINSLVLQNLFPPNTSVGNVQMNNDELPVNIYKGMRVVIMQNRDKKNGVVNGQPAMVLMMQGLTQPRTQPLSLGKERPWLELVTCHPDSGW